MASINFIGTPLPPPKKPKTAPLEEKQTDSGSLPKLCFKVVMVLLFGDLQCISFDRQTFWILVQKLDCGSIRPHDVFSQEFGRFSPGLDVSFRIKCVCPATLLLNSEISRIHRRQTKWLFFQKLGHIYIKYQI